MQKLRIGIVGSGRMGRIRSLSAKAHPRCELVEVVDTIAEHARMLAAETGCLAGTDWQKLIEREDVDAIVVATPHKYLAPITTAALQAGKYVFCEKPGARNAIEAQMVLKSASGNWPFEKSESDAPSVPRNHSRLVVGFTLRHYPAIARARELVDAGVIGEPMYVRGRYGHGGRPDYDLEWRGDPELAGGGELLDQGVHLIDLSRSFLGEFEQVFGSVNTYFWGSRQSSSNTSLEDNAFLSLRTEAGRIARFKSMGWAVTMGLTNCELLAGVPKAAPPKCERRISLRAKGKVPRTMCGLWSGPHSFRACWTTRMLEMKTKAPSQPPAWTRGKP
jgi:predicted dehydrogenase